MQLTQMTLTDAHKAGESYKKSLQFPLSKMSFETDETGKRTVEVCKNQLGYSRLCSSKIICLKVLEFWIHLYIKICLYFEPYKSVGWHNSKKKKVWVTVTAPLAEKQQ